MNKPHILSSGIILDKYSIYDKEGNMLLDRCPMTRKEINSKAYPVAYLKS